MAYIYFFLSLLFAGSIGRCFWQKKGAKKRLPPKPKNPLEELEIFTYNLAASSNPAYGMELLRFFISYFEYSPPEAFLKIVSKINEGFHKNRIEGMRRVAEVISYMYYFHSSGDLSERQEELLVSKENRILEILNYIEEKNQEAS